MQRAPYGEAFDVVQGGMQAGLVGADGWRVGPTEKGTGWGLGRGVARMSPRGWFKCRSDGP